MGRKMRKLLAMVLVLMLISADLAVVAEEIGALVLPSALRIIDKEAFYGDTSIGKVVVPDGATEIRSKAFADSTLNEIELPDTLTSIAEDAFDGCEDFEITAEEGSYAYEWAVEKGYIESTLTPNPAGDFEYSISDGECTITGYVGSSTEVVIPEKIEGAPVTSIGYCAFMDCSSLTSITLSEGVTRIDRYAFSYCSSLTSITIPEGVTSIEWSVFADCSSLTSVTLPEGITSIGNSAFDGCSSLTSITLPEGVTSIGDYAFYDCKSLTSITMPEGVTSIGEWAFSGCSSLTSITLPEGVASIDIKAFRNCNSLKEIELPATLTFIAEDAFDGCEDFEITAEEGSYAYEWAVEKGYIEEKDISESEAQSLFYDVKILDDGTLEITNYYGQPGEEIDIPASFGGRKVSSIGDQAFKTTVWENEETLKKIIIPEGVVHIGDEAFYGTSLCGGIEEIILPSTLKSIGARAFACNNIKNFVYPRNLEDCGWAAFGLNPITSYSIPEGVTHIPARLFSGCGLEKVDFPDSLVSIGEQAFACNNFETITISKSIQYVGDEAFGNCDKLKEVCIEGDFWSGGRDFVEGRSVGRPFYQCDNLTTAIIKEGVKSLDDYLFGDNESLTEIRFPSTLKHIGIATLAGTGLKEIRFPDSLETIGVAAIQQCEKLTRMYLPPSVREIGEYQFGISDECIIYGEAGSYAETYAKEQGIAFSTKDWNYGDKAQYVSVSGCVQMEDGTPIANAYITIHSDGDHKTSTTAVTDSTGNWSVDGIWAGRSYTLECAAAGFKFESRTFRTGTSDKNLGVIIGTADGTFVLLDQQVVRADASGMERTITVTSNDTWTVKVSADWMHVSSESGEGKGTFTLSIDENAGKFRSGAVTVTGTKQECTIYVLQSGALSKKLDDPVITTPAENGITVPYGDIEVAWDGVEYADHYVISLRDVTTNELLLFHDEKAITGENTATLLEDYFFDGREYRMAIGAVPAGVDSTDPLVSWCERVINVAAIEVAEDATLSGRVYGQQIDADDGKVTKEPLYGAVVVIAQVVDGVEDIVGSVVTDEQGYWTFENCIIGGMYRIYAYASENDAPVLPQTYSDYDVVVASNVSASLKDDDLQLKLQTGAGVNDTGIQIVNLSDEEAIIQANIQNAAAGLKSGLLAQYFQSKKGDYTARAKRWEEVVATVDFSWEEGTNGRMMSHNQYDKLITHKYDGSGSLSDVLYVKRNDFSAKFTGYLIVGETDTYDLRATGDDGVKLTVTKLNGKNATDSDGWWFGGSNQKAKVSLELEAGVRYPIMLEYYNNGEAANVKLEWKKKSEKDTAYTIIPEANLFYDYSEHKSVRSRAMETLVEMVTVNEKLQETPKTIIKNMATKNFNSYVSDNFFNLDDVVYSSLEDKIKDTAKNTVVKKSVECGFEILVGYSIDPNWAKEDIKEVILDGLKKYTIDLSDTINEKIDDIRENWKVDVADAQVDTTEFLIEFYAWLYEFLPEQYEDIVGEIASEIGYASSDAMFVELNKSFSGKDTLKDGAKEVQKEYKEVRNVFDLAKENMENVKYYKDNNRVRSYLHLMFLEDSDGTYEKYKNLVWLTSYQSPTKETFISCLNDSNNENLKAFLKNYDSYETETEILIYKQLLLSIIEYASDDIFSFYGN